MDTSSKFDVNKSTTIETEEIDGSKIWIFDNFYQYPDEVRDFILSTQPHVHKANDTKTWNTTHFLDLRHNININVSNVFEFLKTFSQQVYLNPCVLTNYSKFLTDTSFNSYKTHYWWPHIDPGYTGIVYFNDDEDNGTNLYELKNPEQYPHYSSGDNDAPDNIPEHWEPWREKHKYKLIKTLKPKYNRCVLFDAKKFLHGQHVAGERYFHDEFRLNQVFFFYENP
jgi:hypothetical protein|tara:strand:+ start:110 stop:784 length:675 start_codon:yes stop_codon:yes gene_type:complete